MSIIDINAKPYVDEIIEIPDKVKDEDGNIQKCYGNN